MVEKVTDYYENLKFNQAISEMMVFINTIYKEKTLSKDTAIKFTQLLSCIAPHIAEEIHEKFLDGNISISTIQ